MPQLWGHSLGMTAWFNRGRWKMNVLTSVLFSVGSYFMFTKLLGVTLARVHGGDLQLLDALALLTWGEFSRKVRAAHA